MSTKKTLKDLTPEIKAKIPEYIERYTRGVFDGKRYDEFRKEDAEELIYFNYEKCNFKKPVVMVAENPLEAQHMFNHIVANSDYWLPRLYRQYMELNGMTEPEKGMPIVDDPNATNDKPGKNTYNYDYLFTCNVYSNNYFGWYKFIKDEFKIEAEIGADLDKFTELYMKSGVYSAIFSELLCVVSKYPKKVYRNDQFRLHNTRGVAVEWGYTEEKTQFWCYYINGRNIPKAVFEKALAGDVTKDDFMNEKNDEIKGAINEILGQEKMLKMLGAKIVNAGTFTHGNGEIEEVKLYKTTERFPELDNQPLAWVEFACPSTGSRYLIDVEPKYNDAREAAIATSPFFQNGINSVDDYKWDERA